MELQFSNHIFLNAKQFYELAKPAIEDEGFLSITSLAVVCNLALCVELTLKANDAGTKGVSVGGDAPLVDGEIYSNLWGHDLEEVFNKLSPAVKSLLETEFKKATNQNLLPLLTKCKRYFEHSRYSHDARYFSTFDISAIFTLAHGLIVATGNIWRA